MNIIELIIDEEAEMYGIDAISLVEQPAIESDFVALKNEQIQFKTQDNEKRVFFKEDRPSCDGTLLQKRQPSECDPRTRAHLKRVACR